MKFVSRSLGKSAEAGSGGGSRGCRREIVRMGGALVAMVLAVWFGTGLIADVAISRIGTDTERRWFGSLSLPDHLAARHLTPRQEESRRNAERILETLAADSTVPDLPFRLFVLNESDPNAFAFPGGTIGVTRGLLDLLDAEIPVAFVLAHELGHFAGRDHLRHFGRQAGRQLVWWLITGTGDGLWLSSRMSGLLDLRHSRSRESAADSFALRLVHRTYGTTEGTDRLFAWLADRDASPAWLEFLQTHPVPADRLDTLRREAATLPTASP